MNGCRINFYVDHGRCYVGMAEHLLYNLNALTPRSALRGWLPGRRSSARDNPPRYRQNPRRWQCGFVKRTGHNAQLQSVQSFHHFYPPIKSAIIKIRSSFADSSASVRCSTLFTRSSVVSGGAGNASKSASISACVRCATSPSTSL